MNQDTLVTALSANLDALSTLVTALLTISAVTLWSTLRSQSTLQLLSIEVTQKHAYVFFSLIFATLMGGIALYFNRLDRLLALLDIDHIPGAISAMMTNESIVNPYAFFGGEHLLSKIADATGPVSISLTMWCGIIALHLMKLRSAPKRVYEGVLGNACIIVFAFALVAMYLSIDTFLGVAGRWSPDLAIRIATSMQIRNYLSFVPAALGLVLIFGLSFIVRWLGEGKSTVRGD